MKTIDATLSAAQKTAAGQPIARASLADAGRLHWQTFLDQTTTLITDAVLQSSIIVRARHNAGAIDTQKITDPTVASQWTTWTAGTVASGATDDFCLFATNSYIVLVWRDSATQDLLYKRSSDQGATWSATATAYSGLSPFAHKLAGVSGANSNSGIMAMGGSPVDIKYGKYNPTPDTWDAFAAAGYSLGAQDSIAAAWSSADSKWFIAFIATTGGVLAPVAFTSRTGAGTWATPRVFYAEPDASAAHTRITLSQAKVNGYWWACWRTTKGAGSSKFWLSASDDGEHFEDPTHLNAGAAGNFKVIGNVSSYFWGAAEADVLRAQTQTYFTNKDVHYYKVDLSDPIEDIVAVIVDPLSYHRRLVAELDNSGTPLTEPKLFTKLTLERGLIAAADNRAYYQALEPYYVSRYEYLTADNVLRIEAVDAFGLLYLWTAEQDFTYTNEQKKKVVELICARAGLHSVTFDADAQWTTTLSTFTITKGTKGLKALEDLRKSSLFDILVQESGNLHFFIPAAAPPVNETYGYSSGQHQYWQGQFGRRVSPSYHLIVTPTYANSAEQSDTAEQADTGRRTVDVIDAPEGVTSSADAATLAAARYRIAQEEEKIGAVIAPTNYALEIGDVIALATGWANTNGPFRLVTYDEEMNSRARKEKYFQRLYLRGTT